VLRQPVPAEGTATPNFFAQFLERPLERYTVSAIGTDTTAGGEITDVVRLVPKVRGMPFREAVIALSRSDSLPRRLALVEESGQRRTLVLEKTALNQPVPPAELRFTPQRGTRVVSP
jgi:outer membrane lipoprotein-sorting protein